MYINNFALELTNKDKSQIDTEFGVADIEKIHIGTLKLKTGNIVATDPIFLYDDQPFNVKVKPSDYKVYAFVADFDKKEKKLALSKIEFTKETPIKWNLAVYEGESADRLKGDEFLGFDVENGICAYMDECVMEELDTLFEEEIEKYEELIHSSIKFSKKEFSFNNLNFGKEGGNIILLSTGWKDGTFPSYVGYDKNNKPCCLVTDFMVLE